MRDIKAIFRQKWKQMCDNECALRYMPIFHKCDLHGRYTRTTTEWCGVITGNLLDHWLHVTYICLSRPVGYNVHLHCMLSIQLMLQCSGNVVTISVPTSSQRRSPMLWQRSFVDTFKHTSNIVWTSKQCCANVVSML